MEEGLLHMWYLFGIIPVLPGDPYALTAATWDCGPVIICVVSHTLSLIDINNYWDHYW